MHKYNVALIPVNRSDAIINFANHFANLADEYLLGPASLPHITLRKFYANDNAVDEIWQRLLTDTKLDSIELTLNELSCLTFNNISFAISLLPDHLEELQQMHKLVSKILGKHEKRSFDPHVTLLNTKDRNYPYQVMKFIKTFQPISDKFTLSIGKSDEVGQYTGIVKI